MKHYCLRIICTLMLFFCLIAIAKGQNSLSNTIEGIKKGFNERNNAILEPLLANQFSVVGGNGQEARASLRYFLNKYPFDQIDYRISETIGDFTKLSFQVTLKNKEIKEMNVLLNSSYQVLYFDLADEMFGMKRNQISRLRAKIPFENHYGKIIIKLRINNYSKPLRFLFDTGADGMAINTALAEEIGLKVTRKNDAAVVGGNMNIKISDGNTIQIDTFSMQGMGIAIFDNVSKDADGLLGNAFLRRFITEIDYDHHEIRLYDFGKFEYKGTGYPVSVNVPNGLLLVPGKLNIVPNKVSEGNFVFDTGASYNVICFRNFVQKHKLLVSGFVPKGQSTTVSMGMATPTFTGISDKFEIPGIPNEGKLPVTLMSGFMQSDKTLPHDGSIGIRLLSRYNLLINLQESKIYFSPNKLHALPEDFMVGPYILGWDNEEVLRIVGRSIGSVDPKLIQEGTEIVSVNKLKAADLAKNKGKGLKKILSEDKAIKIQYKVGEELLIYEGK